MKSIKCFFGNCNGKATPLLLVLLVPFSLVLLLSCGNDIESVTETTITHKFIRDGSSDLNHIYTPVDISVDSTGKLFILDNIQMLVSVLDANGNFLYSFGGKGEAPYEFTNLFINFDLDPSGTVYLIDYLGTLKIFTNEGDFVKSVESGFGQIFDIAATDSNHIYVNGFPDDAAIMNSTTVPAITLLDGDGLVVNTFGSIDLTPIPTGIEGIKTREAMCACALDIDADNSVYYVSTSNYIVYKYDSNGTLVWSNDGPSEHELQFEEMENGFKIFPVVWDLDIYQNQVYVIWAQGGNEKGNRVDVYDKDTGALQFYFYSQVPTEKWNFSIEVVDNSFYVIDYNGALVYCFSLDT